MIDRRFLQRKVLFVALALAAGAALGGCVALSGTPAGPTVVPTTTVAGDPSPDVVTPV